MGKKCVEKEEREGENEINKLIPAEAADKEEEGNKELRKDSLSVSVSSCSDATICSKSSSSSTLPSPSGCLSTSIYLRGVGLYRRQEVPITVLKYLESPSSPGEGYSFGWFLAQVSAISGLCFFSTVARNAGGER